MTRSVVGYHQPLVQSCKATTLSETFLMTCKHKIKALIGYICILHVIQIKKKTKIEACKIGSFHIHVYQLSSMKFKHSYLHILYNQILTSNLLQGLSKNLQCRPKP